MNLKCVTKGPISHVIDKRDTQSMLCVNLLWDQFASLLIKHYIPYRKCTTSCDFII